MNHSKSYSDRETSKTRSQNFRDTKFVKGSDKEAQLTKEENVVELDTN